jgi:hypothetical protein
MSLEPKLKIRSPELKRNAWKDKKRTQAKWKPSMVHQKTSVGNSKNATPDHKTDSDHMLKRQVGLKTLPPQMRQRIDIDCWNNMFEPSWPGQLPDPSRKVREATPTNVDPIGPGLPKSPTSASSWRGPSDLVLTVGRCADGAAAGSATRGWNIQG